jgi:hypothetical protein
MELLARAWAHGVPVPLYGERALHEHAPNAGAALPASERVRALREWAESHPITPPLSDDAISRESLYGDRG